MKRSPASSLVGVGLRFAHHEEMRSRRPQLGWLEVHTENYMGGGPNPRALDVLRADYPVSLHGVGLSLGSADGLDETHLARVAAAVARFAPARVSEHLSWSIAGGHYLADLLPMPLTEETLAIFVRNVDALQTRIGRAVLIENPSTYLQFRGSDIPEWEFLAELCARTGCGILCDVNNIYVSACNHGLDAGSYITNLPAQRVGEIHLAGHAERTLEGGRTLLVDDHGSPVCEAVWALYEKAVARFGAVPTLMEWDTNIPPLDTLLGEAVKAESVLARAAAGVCDAA
ncbi:MAG: DUF692 domain-containing protein [Alphaproteobacteria bacterium]